MTGVDAAANVALTVQLAAITPVLKLLTPEAVAVPLQPVMLWVTKPLAGVAVQVVVLPPVTGLTQFNVPFAPALAVTVY